MFSCALPKGVSYLFYHTTILPLISWSHKWLGGGDCLRQALLHWGGRDPSGGITSASMTGGSVSFPVSSPSLSWSDSISSNSDHVLQSNKLSKVGDLSRRLPEGSFPMATTPRYREEHYSIPWIAPLYPWYLPYSAEC